MVTRTHLTVTRSPVLLKAGTCNTAQVMSSSTWSLFPFKISAHVARNCRLSSTVQAEQLVPPSLPFLSSIFCPSFVFFTVVPSAWLCAQHNSRLTHASVCSHYVHLATAGGSGFESLKALEICLFLNCPDRPLCSVGKAVGA